MLTVPNPIAHISSSVRTVEWPFPKYVSDVGACCRRQHSTSPAGPAEGPADLGVSRSCVVLDTTSIAWLPVGMCATGATRAGSPSQLCTRPLGGPRPPAPRRVRWWAFEKRCRGYLARRRASVGDERCVLRAFLNSPRCCAPPTMPRPPSPLQRGPYHGFGLSVVPAKLPGLPGVPGAGGGHPGRGGAEGPEGWQARARRCGVEGDTG